MAGTAAPETAAPSSATIRGPAKSREIALNRLMQVAMADQPALDAEPASATPTKGGAGATNESDDSAVVTKRLRPHQKKQPHNRKVPARARTREAVPTTKSYPVPRPPPSPSKSPRGNERARFQAAQKEKTEAILRMDATGSGGGGFRGEASGSSNARDAAPASEAKAARLVEWLEEQQRDRGAAIKKRQLVFKAKRKKIVSAEEARQRQLHARRAELAARDSATDARLRSATAEQMRHHGEWERSQRRRRARIRRRQKDNVSREEERKKQLERELRERERKRQVALAAMRVQREEASLLRRQAARQCQVNRARHEAEERDAALARLQRVDQRAIQMEQAKASYERDIEEQLGEELRFRSQVSKLAYELSTAPASPSAAAAAAHKIERLRERYTGPPSRPPPPPRRQDAGGAAVSAPASLLPTESRWRRPAVLRSLGCGWVDGRGR